MALHPDGRHLVVTNNGYSKPSLRVVDLERLEVVQKLPLDARVARAGLAPGRQAPLLLGRRGQHGPGDRVAGRPARAGREPSRSRRRRRSSTTAASRARASSAASRSRPTAARSTRDTSRRALTAVDVGDGTRARAGRRCPPRRTRRWSSPDGQHGVRLAVGRREGRCASSRGPCGRTARSRSASTRTRWRSPGTAGGCSSPARTRTRCGWSTSRRARRSSRSAMALLPDAPPGIDAERARALARRRAPCSSPTPTTTPSRSSTSATPGESRVRGFIPTGWYPTGVALQPRRRADLRAERQGADVRGRTRAGRSRGIPAADAQYIGGLLQGRCRVLPPPDAARARSA